MFIHDVVLFDVETDGLDYTKVHCIAVSGEAGPPILFTDMVKFYQWACEYTDEKTMWVAHNACGFDYWVINELTDVTINRDQVFDTSVAYKLADYKRFNTFSLDEIGSSLGCPKTEYTGGWDEFTYEMGEYCKQDVKVLQRIYKACPYAAMYGVIPSALETELEIALICEEMRRNGFRFNKDKAQELLDEVTKEMAELEDEMQKAWPPELVEDRRIKWRMKDDGTPYATCLKAQAAAPKWEIKDDELILYKYKDFNPGSSKDRVDKLWEAGWKPFDKTKGHIQHERSKRWRKT